MALRKVARTQLGKFGSLTSASHAKKDSSIFGSNACSTVCSYKDSFGELSIGDNGSFDIFSSKGQYNLEKEKEIIEGKDKKTTSTKNFEMNAKSFAMLQKELGITNNKKRVTLNS